MFKWFRGAGDGLEDVQETFLGMLRDGRTVFDLAMRARVEGADPDSVSAELLRTEAQTDEAEQRIRRLILVHASVHGSVDIPACLMYMSIAKDAERVSDLSKGLFGIAATVGAPPEGPLRADLTALGAQVSAMIGEAERIFANDDPDAAHEFINRARELQDHCHARIDELLREDVDAPQPTASGLTYRHLARIVANLLNVVSSVVMPLDQLDYPERDDADADLHPG